MPNGTELLHETQQTSTVTSPDKEVREGREGVG